MHQSICLFFFSHSSISFFCSSTSYYIRSWVNRFADSFFTFTYFLSFLCFILIYNMKQRQSFCLFILSYSSVSFFFASTSYSIWSEAKRFACSSSSHSTISFSFDSLSYSIWSQVNVFVDSFVMNKWIDFCHFILVLVRARKCKISFRGHRSIRYTDHHDVFLLVREINGYLYAKTFPPSQTYTQSFCRLLYVFSLSLTGFRQSRISLVLMSSHIIYSSFRRMICVWISIDWLDSSMCQIICFRFL